MKASPSDQRQIIDVAAFDQKTTALHHSASILPEAPLQNLITLAIFALQQRLNSMMLSANSCAQRLMSNR
jgi:hypothetical protein